MRHERTKRTAIPKSVKHKVYLRDGMRCLMCGRMVREENACCHLIPRSQGGMGVEKNILTLCHECHRKFDEGKQREVWGDFFHHYLEEIYGPIDRSEVVYDKWGFLNVNKR